MKKSESQHTQILVGNLNVNCNAIIFQESLGRNFMNLNLRLAKISLKQHHGKMVKLDHKKFKASINQKTPLGSEKTKWRQYLQHLQLTENMYPESVMNFLQMNENKTGQQKKQAGEMNGYFITRHPTGKYIHKKGRLTSLVIRKSKLEQYT